MFVRARDEWEAAFRKHVLPEVARATRALVAVSTKAQRELSIQVVEAKGDYLWFLKENQKTLYADLECPFCREYF